MTEDLSALPLPEFAGGRGPIMMTPVVGEPGREYAEAFVPGEEELEDGELRVTVLGSGNPWVTRAPASGSILLGDGIRAIRQPGGDPIRLDRVGDGETTSAVNVRYRPIRTAKIAP